ncbi:MAG: hypothetical protein K6F05_05635 [Succinivibrio sp.]|nr:hypothetical protein [Succinivibrio sp.]
MRGMTGALLLLMCAISSAEAAPYEKCGTVIGSRVLNPGHYSLRVFVDRELSETTYYFEDFQNGGVPNNCVRTSALNQEICFDVVTKQGQKREYESISNCRQRQ